MTPLKEMPEITEPAQAELALAMAIVKYKPATITVLDYLKTISEDITDLKGPPNGTNKYFNSVKKWHHAYLESKAERERLENAVFELYCWKEAALAALPPAKRKALDETDETLDTDGKRPKLAGVENESQQDPVTQVPQVPKVPKVNSDPKPEQGKSFLRCIAALEHAMKDPIPDERILREEYWKALALKAVLVCKMAERGLLTVVRVDLHLNKPGSPLENRQPSFIAVKNAVELAFRAVLRAFHKFPVSGHEREYAWRSQRRVIYYLVCLFESTMTALFEYAYWTAAEKKEAVESTPGAEQQQNEASGPSRASTGTQHEMAHRLVDLLCNMAISLNKNTRSDCPVIEGVLFLIMDRLGELLRYFTFDGQNPDAPLPVAPAGAREEMERMDVEAAQIEAKYLVFFLKRWLKEKPQFPFTFCYGGPGNKSYVLDEGIKSQMTKTLLQAIFGKAEALFQGGLRRVATPEPDDYEEPPELEREEFSHWFIGELWALIGWDILEFPRPKTFTKHPAEEGDSAETEDASDSEDSSDSSA